MEVYVLRHGHAEPRRPDHPDAERALIPKGKRGVRDVLAMAQKAKAAPQLILTSPLLRAQETAAVAATVFADCPVSVTRGLLPSGSAEALWKELCANPALSRVLLVGHSPHLEQLIAYLLGAALSVDLKKGALVSIACPQSSAPPHGALQWMLTPRLARSS